jgi:hypothetical protein
LVHPIAVIAEPNLELRLAGHPLYQAQQWIADQSQFKIGPGHDEYDDSAELRHDLALI